MEKIKINKITSAPPAASPANKASAQLMNQQETYLKDSTREGSSFLYAIYAKKNSNSIVNKFKQIYDLNNLLPSLGVRADPLLALMQNIVGLGKAAFVCRGVNITCTGEPTIGVVSLRRKIIEPKCIVPYILLPDLRLATLDTSGGAKASPSSVARLAPKGFPNHPKAGSTPKIPGVLKFGQAVYQNADATRERMKDNRANRELTQAQKDHIAKLNENCNTPERIAKSKQNLAAHIAKSSKAVEITNIETGKTVTYESQREAARQLGINHNSIRNYIKSQKLFLGKYKIAVKGQVVSIKENPVSVRHFPAAILE